MRKHWILGASAIILASSVMACGKKEEAATTAAGTEKAAETTAAAEEKKDYVFVKMTVPYADFYYGELKDIAPEEGKDVKAQLDAEDKVTKDGFRETGMYDSVSSPTKEKVEKFVMADAPRIQCFLIIPLSKQYCFSLRQAWCTIHRKIFHSTC